MPLDEGYRQARNDVKKALELDPNLADALAALGWIQMTYDWDWAGADSSYRRALELEPGNATVIRNAAGLATTLGRLDEALTLNRRAAELDPLSVSAHYYLGIHAYYAGHFDEAEAAVKKSLELNPDYPAAHLFLGQIYLAKSQPEKALAEIQKEPEPLWRDYGLALAYHAAGKKQDADTALAEYVEKRSVGSAFQIAEIYAYRGETDKAFEWLEVAYNQRDGGLADMKRLSVAAFSAQRPSMECLPAENEVTGRWKMIGEIVSHYRIAMEMMERRTLKYDIGGKPMEIDQQSAVSERSGHAYRFAAIEAGYVATLCGAGVSARHGRRRAGSRAPSNQWPQPPAFTSLSADKELPEKNETANLMVHL